MKQTQYTYPSATGQCTIHAWQWCPEHRTPKAAILLHHGMAEHTGRYKNALRALVEDYGYAVFMNDMANHGQSNDDEAMLGYFGKTDGWKKIIADAHHLFEIMYKEYPSLKHIVGGHSMGSFIMRSYFNFYHDPVDGAIFIGTSGKNALAGVGIGLTSLICGLKGPTCKTQMLYEIALGGYDKPFEHRTRYDWGIRDTKSVDDYVADPKCGFLFTAAGYRDLMHLVTDCNSAKWFANMPKDLPILLLSGDKDPVGNFGKGVTEVRDRLKATGHTNVTMKLYGNARHEILNELNKESVYQDLDAWITNMILHPPVQKEEGSK